MALNFLYSIFYCSFSLQDDILHGCYLLILLLSFTYKMVEKELFLGRIFEMEILMDLQILWDPKSENYIFSSYSACPSVFSITQKLITAETSRFMFYNCIIYGYYLKLFMTIDQKSVYRDI